MAAFLQSHGATLLARGYQIIPIAPGAKHPAGLKHWERIDAKPGYLKQWLSNGRAHDGVGVLTRRTPAIDLDIRDPAIVDRMTAWIIENLDHPPQRTGQAPKTLFVFRTDEPFRKMASAEFQDPLLGTTHRIEVLGDGQQFVAYAIHPDTNEPYRWSGPGIADIDHGDLPLLTPDKARALIGYFESIVPDDWERVKRRREPAPPDDTPIEVRPLANATPPADVTLNQIQQCLDELADYADDYERWTSIGMALYHQFDGGADGFDLWDDWSRFSDKYRSAEMAAKWRSFKANLTAVKPLTFRTAIRWAKDHRRQYGNPTTDDLFMPGGAVIEKLGPVNWLVENYIEADTTGLLFGDPGVFKSFLALDMALAIAANIAWHGNPVTGGLTLYIAGEGHNGMARRLRAWEIAHQRPVNDLPIHFSRRAVALSDPDSLQAVVASIDKIKTETGQAPRLICIDTLARNFGAADENSTADMNVFVDHVDRLLRARHGATVLIVHHTGQQNKGRARGSTALKGGMDFEYRLDREPGRDVAVLTCTKMKDAIEPPMTWFEAETVPIGDFETDGMTSLVLRKLAAPVAQETPLKGKQKMLFDTIKTEHPIDRDTLRQITIDQKIFQTAQQFRNAFNELRKKGLIDEIDNHIKLIEDFPPSADTEIGA